jgi:hypothetical protein
MTQGSHREKQEGKAARGSQYWLQRFVNEQPTILSDAIKREAPALVHQSIEWLSPLASERYREYQDQAFLEKLGVKLTQRPLESFWPKGGPVWDGLARTSKGGIILVEAKSHIPEAVSPPSRASKKSLPLIRSSLEETKQYLNGNADAVWTGIFYQVTNRLAHLYLLRKLNNIPAHLAFVYFFGDEEMNGPETVNEWRAAIRVIETFLGIERTKLSPFIHHVFLNIREIDPNVDTVLKIGAPIS